MTESIKIPEVQSLSSSKMNDKKSLIEMSYEEVKEFLEECAKKEKNDKSDCSN